MSSSRSTATRDRARRHYRRYRPPCHLCGQPIDYDAGHLDPSSFVVDHVHPLQAGGVDQLDNLAPAHRSCNGAKGRRLVSPIVRRSGALE